MNFTQNLICFLLFIASAVKINNDFLLLKIKKLYNYYRKT
jgi:hypothetical protein